MNQSKSTTNIITITTKNGKTDVTIDKNNSYSANNEIEENNDDHNNETNKDNEDNNKNESDNENEDEDENLIKSQKGNYVFFLLYKHNVFMFDRIKDIIFIFIVNNP